MIGTARDAHDKAGQRELRSLLCPQFPGSTGNDINGKRKQQGSTNSGCSAFCALGEGLSISKLDDEAPNQYARRSQLDQAIDAKREKGQTICLYRRTDRNRGFYHHPCDCNVLNPECLLDEGRAATDGSFVSPKDAHDRTVNAHLSVGERSCRLRSNLLLFGSRVNQQQPVLLAAELVVSLNPAMI
jgi:hypothetical protein